MNAPATQLPLPQYRSHKVVGAAKIVGIWDGDKLDLGEFGSVTVGPDWIINKEARQGGYFVAYNDGFTSYSPAKAFEEGYRAILAPAAGTVVYGMATQNTAATALAEARHLLALPHMMSDERTMRRLLANIIAGIDQNKCFAKAMANGLESFTLLETDKAAPAAIRIWAAVAEEHGCNLPKVHDAQEIAGKWDDRPERKWPA